jgi:hypothetical protein
MGVKAGGKPSQMLSLLVACFEAGFLFFAPEDGGDIFLRNVGLHGVIYQKIELIITAAVSTLNPTIKAYTVLAYRGLRGTGVVTIPEQGYRYRLIQ